MITLPNRVMVDIDDSICNMMDPVLYYLKTEKGVDVDREQLTHFTDIGNYVDYGLFLDAVEANLPFFSPFTKMVGVVNELYFAGSQIVIATSRGYADDAYNVTLNWLLNHGVNFDELHVVDECKSVYFANTSFDVVVEDKAECVERMFEKNLIRDNAFLVDAPWNRYYDHPDVIRINPHTATVVETSNVF